MNKLLKSIFIAAVTVMLFTTTSYASQVSTPYEEIFRNAAVNPEYPGGPDALIAFINKNINYPQTAQDNGIQGKVVVQFVIEKDGSVGLMGVARSVDPELDKEAMRVCKMLNDFTPGRNTDGEPVRVWYKLPIIFKLTGTGNEEISPEDPNVAGEALKYYQDALAGDADAQYNLGNCYYTGNGVNKDLRRAAYWYQKSAIQGNEWAMGSIGYCYANGEGVELNYTQAVEWWKKSANLGNANACNSLGVCYQFGDGVEKDFDQAFYWFSKATEKGNPYGQYNLADCYYNGEGVQQDYGQAFLLYYMAAESGMSEAQNSLAECYYNGIGTDQNFEQAVYWYTKAANQNNSKAIKKLPSACALLKDYDNMRYWYQKANEIEDEYMENYDIGYVLYSIAEDVYPNKNFLSILQDAASQGNDDALSTLACLYAIGKDVEQDDKKAVDFYRQYLDAKDFTYDYVSIADVYYLIAGYYNHFFREQYPYRKQWLEKSAELGCSDAQYDIGVSCASDQDYENALLWWRKAANQGDYEAMREIGNCYEDGLGVAKDHKTALQWYKKAADLGDSYSQFFIGECYLSGNGVTRSEKKATRYFKMAAENGDEDAKYSLGQCFYEGKGVKKDYKQAAEWFADVCNVYLSNTSSQTVTEMRIVEDEIAFPPAKAADEIRVADGIIGAGETWTPAKIYEQAMQGESWAQYELAELYLKNGDTENAMLWLEKAAQNGSNNACEKLAEIYCGSELAERDYNKALYWYKKATNNDDEVTIDAMLYNLAKENYYDGDSSYLSLMQQASKCGNKDALEVMAALYAIGKDLPRDDDKAVEYYKLYKETINEPTPNATIANVYYHIYKNEYGVIGELYDEESIQWLEKAAELANADAQYEMGKHYDYGVNDKDKDRRNLAIAWYRKAAEQGHPEAQSEMGYYYNYEGDFTQAVQWFTKAAVQGSPESQYRLATLYATGKGVKKDKKIANEYYQKSATGFKALAEETLNKLGLDW